MGIRSAAATAAVVFAIAGCGNGDRAALPGGTPVVIISIDTLRSDRLPVYGYQVGQTPAIDRLAGDGIVFERCYTPVPLTLPAHVSLLSGLLPPAHGVRDNLGYSVDAERVPMLQRQLRERGYATGAAVSAYVLRAATGIAMDFDFYDDDVGPRSGAGLQAVQRPGTATLEAVRPWLRSVADRPFFLLFHIFEPHSPYEPPEPFASRFASLYDGEVATADAVVGDLLDELRDLGAYDRALIFLLSDHGEGLGEHGEDEHGLFLYRSTLQVPLIMKLPGGEQAGTSVGHTTQLIDVAPTVLEGLGVAAGVELQGHSLLGPPPAADTAAYAETLFPRLHFGWSDLASVIVGRHHFIAAPRPELYDLQQDPGETENLLQHDPDTAGAMAARLDDWDRPVALPGAADIDTRRRLEALGYLGSTVATGGGPLPDPKDRVHVLRRLREASRLLAEGDPEGAASAFAAVVAEDPGIEDAWDYLAQAHLAAGRDTLALAAYRDGLEAIPGSSRLALGAAALLVRSGELDQAEELALRGVQHDEAAARSLLAQIAAAGGDLDKAEREARRAITVADGRPGPVLVLARVLLAAKRPNDAVAVLTEALESGLRDDQLRLMLAELLVAGGDPAGAEQVAAGLEESQNPQTLLALGRLAAAQQQLDRAATLFERARQLAPENPTVLINLGVLAVTRGRLDEGRGLLERGLRGAPDSFEGWNALGMARAQGGDPDGAIAAWQRALEIQPAASDLLFNLGLAHAQAGRPAEAVRYLESYAERAEGPQRDRALEMARRLRRQAPSGD